MPASGYGGHNDVDRELDEFSCDLCVALGMLLRLAVLDFYGAASDPAEFAQPLLKGTGPAAQWRSRGVPRKPTSGTSLGCCARAASGQATAAPPTSVMKSRRFISPRSPPRWNPKSSVSAHFPKFDTKRQRSIRAQSSGARDKRAESNGTQGLAGLSLTWMFFSWV